MAAGVKWYGGIVKARVDAGMTKNLTRAALYVVRQVKLSLNQAGPTKTNPDMPASEAGQPPHRRTGNLAKSITHEIIGMTARVGSTMKQSEGGYAKYLEVGTSKMAARPYLRPAVYKNRRQIKKLLAGKIV